MRLPLVTRGAIIFWLIAEFAVFVILIRWLGFWPVFWLMLATGFLGAWLIRKEGIRAWSAMSAALRSGQPPDRDMSSSGAVMSAGFLLAMPGFVTDALGLLLLLPVTRRVVRRLWTFVLPPLAGLSGSIPGGGRGPRRPGPADSEVVQGEVIEGEVIDTTEQRGTNDGPDDGPDSSGSARAGL